MTFPPERDSGRPDFQPATPPQTSATPPQTSPNPPFVGAEPVPNGASQSSWPPPGMYPMAFPVQVATGPQRPGSATAASVLGIIGGSLGLPFGILMMFGSSIIVTDARHMELHTGVLLILYSLATVAAAIMLLVAGITHLKGQGHVVLTVGAALQVLLVLIVIGGSLFNRNPVPPVVLIMLIGLGLGVSTLILTHTSAAREWRRRKKEQGARPPHAVVR